MFLQLGILGTSGTVRTSLPLEKKKEKKKPEITPEIQRYVEGFFKINTPPVVKGGRYRQWSGLEAHIPFG